MIWVIQILAIIVIWLSFWSLIPRDEWWIRGADFPRLQILVLGFIAFILFLLVDHPWNWLNQLLFIGLMAALAYQLKMVLPYTFIWKNRSSRSSRISWIRNVRFPSSFPMYLLITDCP